MLELLLNLYSILVKCLKCIFKWQTYIKTEIVIVHVLLHIKNSFLKFVFIIITFSLYTNFKMMCFNNYYNHINIFRCIHCKLEKMGFENFIVLNFIYIHIHYIYIIKFL